MKWHYSALKMDHTKMKAMLPPYQNSDSVDGFKKLGIDAVRDRIMRLWFWKGNKRNLPVLLLKFWALKR